MKNINYINYDWSEVQKYYDDGHYWNEVSEKFRISIKTIKKYRNNGYLIDRDTEEQRKLLNRTKKVFKHKNETKERISISRKKYLKDNPDKIKWVGNKSAPSERFKEILRINNISFVEEFRPLVDRFFNIDISFPDKKIGIEINGEQHYERDGRLKKYYQDRHDLIVNEGWVLYEIHTSLVYKKYFIETILLELKNNFNLGNIDYSFYTCVSKLCDCGSKKAYNAKLCINCFRRTLKKKEKVVKIKIKKENDICKCGSVKTNKSKVCLTCFNKRDRKNKRKVDRPPYEKLLDEIKIFGYCGTARKYGVCDNTIRKWVRTYER